MLTSKFAFSRILTTFFEPTNARQVFPSLGTEKKRVTGDEANPVADDPWFKAIFSISLVVPEDLKAYSNAPQIARTNIGLVATTINFVQKANTTIAGQKGFTCMFFKKWQRSGRICGHKTNLNLFERIFDRRLQRRLSNESKRNARSCDCTRAIHG